MKAKDLLSKNDVDLAKQLSDLGEKLSKLSMDVQLKKQKNYNLIKAMRSDIARIQTVLRERALIAETTKNTPAEKPAEKEVEKEVVK